MEENVTSTTFFLHQFGCPISFSSINLVVPSVFPPSIWSSHQFFLHQLRRTTKNPPSYWPPSEFLLSNEEKVYWRFPVICFKSTFISHIMAYHKITCSTLCLQSNSLSLPVVPYCVFSCASRGRHFA